jgi:hypothetical protein
MNTTLKEICKIAYSYEATVEHSYIAAVEMIKKGIAGCFVECGVGAGAQIAAMQLAMLNAGSWTLGALRQILAFDSYQGIPLAGPNDAEQPGIGAITHDVNLPIKDRLCSSGQTVHSVSQVKSNLSGFGLLRENISFIEGWFQDTLPFYAKSTGPIALLRLDGDLYESTLCCLQELYPNVAAGGIVIIDDYALAGCRKAVEDYFKYDAPGGMPVIHEVEGGHGPVFFYR